MLSVSGALNNHPTMLPVATLRDRQLERENKKSTMFWNRYKLLNLL